MHAALSWTPHLVCRLDEQDFASDALAINNAV